MFMLAKNNYGVDLFEEMFRKPFFVGKTSPVMKTDIMEKDGGYLMEIDLPGFNKENVRAEFADGYLTISATNSSTGEEKDDKTGYICRERHYGSCSRSFYIGEDVLQEDIKASYKDGILCITFPKKDAKEIEAKHIPIE